MQLSKADLRLIALSLVTTHLHYSSHKDHPHSQKEIDRLDVLAKKFAKATAGSVTTE